MPKPGETGRGAQFPGHGALPARVLQRSEKVLFSGRGGGPSALQQKQFTFDAQEVGDEWTAARKRLLVKEKELVRQRDALSAAKKATQYTMGGEWKRESGGCAGRRPNMRRKGTNDEGHPKEGEKSDDETHHRDT
jgi:hypothetical protein